MHVSFLYNYSTNNLAAQHFKLINNGFDKTKFKNVYRTVAENELVLRELVFNRRQKDEPTVFSEMDELEFLYHSRNRNPTESITEFHEYAILIA